MLTAELAYLFRHGLMRDAAYELQLPGDRAKLHELSFYLIEAAHGGRAPEPWPLDEPDQPKFEGHSTDEVAAELAFHAELALAGFEQEHPELAENEKLYLRRAAEYTEHQLQVQASIDA